MRIERLTEDDWAQLRDVRLRALREDGDAFGSSLSREEGFTENHWRMRLRSSAWFMAHEVIGGDDDAERPVGIVAGIQEPGAAEQDRHVVSMWVAPEARRRGIGAALLEALGRWAADDGAATVSLWVVEGNEAASELYGRAGFVRTGATMALPRDPSQVEHRWVLDLDGAAARR